MPVKITNSFDEKAPPLVMCIYSQGGVGKTTLASTAPNPIFIDAEHGTKALGARGINVPIVHVSSWIDVQDAWKLVSKDDKYQTFVIDPVGAFLELLIDDERAGGDMNLKKWGSVKERMRRFVWAIKSSGKHVIFVAHEAKDKDDDQQLRKPMLAVNLSDELVNLCDVVGHLRIDSAGIRTLRVQPEPKYQAKDRFDALGSIVEKPNITEIIKSVHARYDAITKDPTLK